MRSFGLRGVCTLMLRLWMSVTLVIPALCGAQVTGTFWLDKAVVAPGEPVFLNLTLSNEGAEPEEVQTADPYSFCSGYNIQIMRTGFPIACSQTVGGSCLSGEVSLEPHASHTERILLNYPNRSQGEFSSQLKRPGDYEIDALRMISYAPPDPVSGLLENPNSNEVHQHFTLRVDETLELPSSTYAPFVQQLASQDEQVRSDAARALATLAPPTLEPLLLTFATSKNYVLKQFAPLALANLSTMASLSALAEMLTHTEPGSYESMSAAEYLGRTHDPKWFPVLLDVSDKNDSMYLNYAAESGGEAALPALLLRMDSTEPGVRSSATYALGGTGSRAAVPLLISLLNKPASYNEQDYMNEVAFANVALEQLTHVHVERTTTENRAELGRRWQRWWLVSGRDAKVYKSDECGPDTQLP